MSDSQKIIDWLNTKPVNFDKLDKALNFHQGTSWRVSKGKAIKHQKTIIEYFKKEMSWGNS
jgi:hypothetical protein